MIKFTYDIQRCTYEGWILVSSITSTGIPLSAYEIVRRKKDCFEKGIGYRVISCAEMNGIPSAAHNILAFHTDEKNTVIYHHVTPSPEAPPIQTFREQKYKVGMGV